MKRTTTLLALAFGLVVHGSQGCGIDWSLPKNHFDGVNEFGFVSVWENIGNIDIGDGLVLPLNINFRSDRATSSSTLGSGWHLALLDANIVQIDERTFMMFDPAGPFRLFWRDPKNPSVLSGQAGWKAEIRGDTITAWADCGSKLVFDKGRIALMQLKDKVFTYNYQNGQVSEIRDGNTPILKVEKAPITGEVTGFTLPNNQKIQIERSGRPKVQVVNSQQLVSGVEPSLSKVTKSDGTGITFEYAVDQKLNPTIKNENRVITWNSKTKNIISDAGWIYDIEPSEDRFASLAIGRSDAASGKSEFWHYDSAKGQETIRNLDGVTQITKWFMSGNLAGKIRQKLELSANSQFPRIIKSYLYDENGRLLKYVTESDTFRYQYLENSECKVYRNNILTHKLTYVNSDTRPDRITLLTGAKHYLKFEYFAEYTLIREYDGKTNKLLFTRRQDNS